MLAKQREMLVRLSRQLQVADEKTRLLLRENLDMKDFMKENDLDYAKFEVADCVLDGDYDDPDS